MVGVAGLIAQGAGEVLEALEAEASFEADVVPGAGAVVVGAEEVVDAPEVSLDVEQQLAEPLALEERAAGCQASLELLAVVLEAVEEAVACLGVPVLWGVGAAEGVEEALEDAAGGGGGLLWVVGVVEGVGEGEGGVQVLAGRVGAGSHVLEELGAVPGEGGIAGPEVVAGEGGGESRAEEQERRGAVAQAGLWGCGRSHGGAWVVLGRSLVRLGGGAGGRCAWGAAGWPALCGAAAFPLSVSDCSEFPAVAFSFGWWLWWSWGSALVGWPCVGRAAVCSGEVGRSGWLGDAKALGQSPWGQLWRGGV